MAEIVSLSEAVRELVADEHVVALEGFTHLIPHAAAHELIRQGRRDLTLMRMTPDIVYDQLIGMGCARKLVFSWGGNPGVGSLHRLRDAVENGWPGPLELEEHSHAGMAAAYAAGAANLPFGVLRGYAGTDLVAHTRVASIDVPVHRRGARGGARAPPGRRRSSTPSRPTGTATCSSGGSPACRRRSCSPPRHSLVTVEEIVDELDAPARCRRAPVVGDRRRRLRAARRASVVRARLLRARQRVLRRLGGDQPRPRHVHRVDARARARGDPGWRDAGPPTR